MADNGSLVTLVPNNSAEARGLVALAGKTLAAAGQDDFIWGHPSVRDPDGRGIWIKSSGWGMGEIDEDRVVLVSNEGEILEGQGTRHIEFHIHVEILKRRPELGAVVHTHSDAANAFSALGVPLVPISHAGSLFCYPPLPRFELTGGLIKTAELGRELAETLGDARACFLPQHGLVTVGVDAPTAVMTAILLDKACRLQLSAMAAGEIVAYGGESDTVAKRGDVWGQRQLREGWDYLQRTAVSPTD